MPTISPASAVQERTGPSARRPVLVGVDGSAPSKAALSWAAHYAALSGHPLWVMAVWHLPNSYGWALPFPAHWDPEADARALLEGEVKEVLGPDPGEGVSLTVVEGPPAKTLVDASASAALVVVGNRGHGEFAGMLLGSVSAFLTAHAHCSVLVVRDGADDASAE